MSRTAGKICILIGVLFLGAALIWLGMNKTEERRGEQIAGERLLEMQAIQTAQAKTGENKQVNPEVNPAQTLMPENPAKDQPARQEMPTVEIDGVSYIGSIRIPDAKIELPVRADWSEAALKETPCRYNGSLYTDDLVIAGHNYARHFSPIKKLKTGASILFTDAEGNEYEFEVIALETIKGRDIQGMLKHDVPWELTLFTCTYGGGDRFAVRCQKK